MHLLLDPLVWLLGNVVGTAVFAVMVIGAFAQIGNERLTNLDPSIDASVVPK